MKNKASLLFLGLAIIALVLIVVADWYDLSWSDFLPAALRPSGRPGGFTLEEITVSCDNDLPAVNLNWTTSSRTYFYIVQRKPADQRSWRKTQLNNRLTQRNFIDTLWNDKYEPGEYSYRVKAYNKKGSRTSNNQNIIVPNCQPAEPEPYCGDGNLDDGEECDDGNNQDGDGCTANCLIEETSGEEPLTMKWGAYVGWQLSDLPDFESQIGQEVNHQTLFIHWGNENEFPSHHASQLRDQGKTMIIFWQAMDYNIDSVNQPLFSYDNILSGYWDDYFTSFAAEAKAYQGPIILIPFEEMNGNWYPWSGTTNNNTPAKHIEAYHYVHSFFTNVPNVKFGWAANHDSVPDNNNNRLEAYYPGDQYVDYVGVNGFNFDNPWQTFSQVFTNALNKLKVYNKPIYIFSFSCADGSRKAGWITDALTVQIPKYSEVVGWNWFNENKEKDWRVWSDSNSLQAFQQALP